MEYKEKWLLIFHAKSQGERQNTGRNSKCRRDNYFGMGVLWDEFALLGAGGHISRVQSRKEEQTPRVVQKHNYILLLWSTFSSIDI